MVTRQDDALWCSRCRDASVAVSNQRGVGKISQGNGKERKVSRACFCWFGGLLLGLGKCNREKSEQGLFLLVWFSVLGFFFSGILVFKLFQFIEPTYRINQLNLARQIQVTFFFVCVLLSSVRFRSICTTTTQTERRQGRCMVKWRVVEEGGGGSGLCSYLQLPGSAVQGGRGCIGLGLLASRSGNLTVTNWQWRQRHESCSVSS